MTDIFRGTKSKYEEEREYYLNYVEMFQDALRPQVEMKGDYRCKNGTKQRPEHSSHAVNFLKKPFPNVLTLNLAWDQDPTRASILKVLLSI